MRKDGLKLADIQAVIAPKGLNYRAIAAGDSLNDSGLLAAADAGFSIHPPPAIAAQFPQFPVHHSYAEQDAAIAATAECFRT